MWILVIIPRQIKIYASNQAVYSKTKYSLVTGLKQYIKSVNVSLNTDTQLVNGGNADRLRRTLLF